MMWKEMTLTGWGRSSRATVAAGRPERARDLTALLGDHHARGVIAYGSGRSYGDAPLNDGGQVLLTGRLNRLLSFDADTGELVCEAGVTFADLQRVFLPRGFCVPVTPGTAFATIGGAVANDVHGKNHDRVGSFGDHVLWLDLVLASGAVERVSPDHHPELFAATIGGVGLTGVILHVCFRMIPVPSPWLTVREQRIADLDGFFDAFESVRDEADYSVGWIDGLARGRRLGRGILETAAFADGAVRPVAARRPRRVPVDLPGIALNPLSVALFNRLYYRRVPDRGRSRAVPAERFFYPLDGLHDWNRIYGKRGFYQFQCVIPDAAARAGIRLALEEIGAARSASFLAVLKTLGGAGRGHLSFPMRGYTLALDFPRRDKAGALLVRLERIVLDHGGRVYLAKDAVLSADGFAAMYPGLADLRAVLAEVDPDRRFQSDLARRLGIAGRES